MKMHKLEIVQINAISESFDLSLIRNISTSHKLEIIDYTFRGSQRALNCPPRGVCLPQGGAVQEGACGGRCVYVYLRYIHKRRNTLLQATRNRY